MAIVTKPMALDESMNTTESTSRNIADVLAQELSGIASAITGGDDKANKTDIATVESGSTASRAYSVGELVYVNGNLYKVITAITIGATFTVGTNIQSANVSGTVKDALDRLPVEIAIVQGTTSSSLNTFESIANFPTGWSANNTYVVGFISHNSNGQWYSNAPEINVMTTENVGIRAKVTAESYVSRPIKVMLARIV